MRLFEAGLRFVGQLPALEQEAMLAGVVTGSREPEGWANAREAVDFFDVKADVEALLAFAGSGGAYRFVPGEHPPCILVKPLGSSAMAGWSALLEVCIPNWQVRWGSISRYTCSS